MNIFRPAVYEQLEAAFRDWLDRADGGTPLPGHDLQGATVTSAWRGPLRLFGSPGWHQLIASATGVGDVTGHVNLGLHHHEPHSAPGFPHNDLNPGWFPARPGGVVLADPAQVEYTTGRAHGQGAQPVQLVRAVAVLFYLANPAWSPAHGGQTGLYLSPFDEPHAATAEVPPHPNSLLAFECTPWSFHGFVGGGSVARNSVVQWLHRRPETVTARWGDDAVVPYGRGA